MSGAVSPIVLIALGVGAYLLYNSVKDNSESKRDFLISQGLTAGIVDQFTASELNDVYRYIKDYVLTQLKGAVPADLKARILAIGSKYNIFT